MAGFFHPYFYRKSVGLYVNHFFLFPFLTSQTFNLTFPMVHSIFIYLLSFEIGFCYVVQAGFELLDLLLPQGPE
jgi:hypothetical protein